MNKLKKEYYKNLLLCINQKRTDGKSNIAKPILLLSIMKLIEDGLIIGNQIRYDKTLVETYNKLFANYAEVITEVQYPYYYMRNDHFYSLKGKAEKKTPSAKYIRENIDYAYLDDGLWELLQDAETREEFKQLITEHYLK